LNENVNLVDIDKMLPKIAEVLFEQEDLCKLLKYDTPNALSESITQEDIKLIFNQDDISCRIFYQPFNDKIMSEKRAELRIYIPYINPLYNKVMSDIDIGFDIVVHNDMWRLDDSIIRPLKILEILIEKLNGINIGNAFDLEFKDKCRIVFYNDNFTGYTFIMKTKSR